MVFLWVAAVQESLEPSTNADELVGTLISQAPAEDLEEEMVDPDSAYDSESASVIRLSNGMVSIGNQIRKSITVISCRGANFSPVRVLRSYI